ncbi:hypothetical protein [Mesorhizobium sp. CN2-181]|uniref:hypothetical protein n=1 Tax=Mesorhizobium yinganensis TaxID=3157707 RepID=UPI0032B77D2A
MDDGKAAIDQNWQALKRVLAMLVAMAELGAGGRFVLFPLKSAAASSPVQAEKNKLSPAFTLPRHLYRAILKLLLPAEAVARRLIIAAARGLVVTLPPLRPRTPQPAVRRGPRAFLPVGPKRPPKPAPRASLPLFDPMPRPFRPYRPHEPAFAIPRISVLGFDARLSPLPPPPSPDDPIDAERLGLRLRALTTALDDLPGQAKRFARWKARRDAVLLQERQGGSQGKGAVRFRRISPLRHGRAPGGRLSRYDPTATRPRNVREIDEILAHAHALAVYALETPDTS